VCVKRVTLRPGDDPREQLEAVDETGSGAHDIGVGVDGPDLVVQTDRCRGQLGEHGTGLLGGPSEVVAGASKWVSIYRDFLEDPAPRSGRDNPISNWPDSLMVASTPIEER
jgi:hypothetical protein